MNKADYLSRLLLGQVAPVKPSSPLQRPAFYCPGLGDQPWHDPSQLAWTAWLEDAYPIIKTELAALRARGNVFRQYREPRGSGYQVLHDQGEWDVFYFYFEGREFASARDLCPETSRLLEAIPRRGGLACFSALAPGSHIRPHCAPFNITLRCHLGLENLDGARMRVGDETRGWQAGKCLILDDTFEHEVWTDGPGVRTVLLLDFFHPGLTDAEVAGLRALWGSPPAQGVLQPWYELVGLGNK